MIDFFYILKDRKIFQCGSNQFSEWVKTTDPHIGYDEIEDIIVSTVFLGIDHGFNFNYKPILFETMFFGGPIDQFMQRYDDLEDSERGHKAAVDCAHAIIKSKGKSWRRVKKYLPKMDYQATLGLCHQQKGFRKYFSKHLK